MCRMTRSLLGLLFAALLAGCSFSYVYRHLDWLVPWYVSDYVTLESGQRSELERWVVKQVAWHCSSQMGSYANWLRGLAQQPEAFSRENLKLHYQTTQHFWHVLMERLAVDAVPVLSMASDEQVAELIDNLEDKNRELYQQYSEESRKERLQQRRERMIRQLERWLGELLSPQQKRIGRWSEALGTEGLELWLAQRRKWQQAFAEALEQRSDSEALRASLRALLLQPEALWSERYRRHQEQRQQLTLELLTDIAAQMTPTQRRHLNQALLDWAAEFDALACGIEDRAAQ